MSRKRGVFLGRRLCLRRGRVGRRLRARFSLHAAAQSIEEDRAEGVGRAEAGDSCRRCRGYRSTSRSGDGGGRRRAARGWDAVITRKNTSHPALGELLL